MELIYFLGRFHVLALHLPIGLIVGVIALEWLARREKYRHLEAAAPFLWAGASIAAIVTAALGYLHFAEGGFEGASSDYHRLFGTVLALLATVAWLLRSYFEPIYRQSQMVLAVLLVIVMTATGHSGGNLTHGATFLAEYAPEPFRSLAGLEKPRPPVTDLAMADPFLDVVRPMLRQRCSSCHSDDKQRGSLNLSTYASLFKGGESGHSVVVAGDSASSELYRRITLPSNHDDFMPAEGKTPLTEAEVAIIGWWIESGAQTGVVLGEADVGDIKPLLISALKLGDGSGRGAGSAADEAAPADPQLVNSLTQSGFDVRQVSRTDANLIVTVAAGRKAEGLELETLITARDQIVELNLQRAGVADAHLQQVAQLSRLTRLHLEGNRISDTGVRSLTSLKGLTYLNLYGNEGVTDASLDALAELTGLQRVYLWGTGVSAKGANELRRRCPELDVEMGAGVGPSPSARLTDRMTAVAF